LFFRSLSSGQSVLDTYCYTGGFSLNAAVGGAQLVTSVDSSKKAMDALRENIALNKQDPSLFRLIQGDAVAVMQELVLQNATFDVVICDPPKLAPSRTGLAKATGKYKKINSLAMKLVKPGGLLLSCTCSAAMTQAQPPVGGFEAMLQEAAQAAGREVTVLRSAGAAMDHPVMLSYPEGRYLTAVLLAVT
jgi:23S rRNA G2069 N7-methylase RlmK/C1962 C5-methylase RlmI